jgi:hypothetical protein
MSRLECNRLSCGYRAAHPDPANLMERDK